ncbi:endonuclease I family protein [Metapseudomonas otitidis]|uniref:endonuclease I family protein n=1 Tax=Metapseudomonas otitidis TaxID=319939 RepID=UPI003CF1DD94
MRVVAIALSLAALAVSSPLFAGGQNRLPDPKAAIREAFWKQLYAGPDTTLYCGKPFQGESGLLAASPVYAIKQIKSALRCVTDAQCREANPQYPYMLADLHNLYPELARVELARRNALFGVVGDAASARTIDDCPLKSSFQLMEPKDEAKGNVARAIFYMHVEYGLPIVGQVQVFKQWHRQDPPDAAERTRNDRIAALQGTRNRFIDDPALVDKLIPE